MMPQKPEPFTKSKFHHRSESNDPIASPLASDPIYYPLVSNFVRSLSHEFMKLNRALGLNDWIKVAQLSHRLKGTAATYGYPELAHSMDILENLAEESLDSLNQSNEGALILNSIASLLNRMQEGLLSIDIA
jgi:HPt (histidine-containing phosphotransfer) domain-containing protein